MRKVILTNGLSDAGLIRRSLTDEGADPRPRVIGCDDDYTSGPLTPVDDLVEFVECRACYWRSLKMQANREVIVDNLKDLTDSILSADQIEIWAGISAQDQMHLMVYLALIEKSGVDIEKVRRVQFSDPASFLFTENILKARPAAEPISREEFQYILRLWRAVSNSDFGQVGTVAGEFPNKIIQSALKTMMSIWVADPDTGLDSRDRRLINVLSDDWQRAAWVIGMTMIDNKMDFTADGVLFHKLHMLAKRGLVELRGAITEMRGCEARLLK